MNIEQIYKAWQVVGADLAGLKWDDFVKALAQPEQEPVTLHVDRLNQWLNASFKNRKPEHSCVACEGSPKSDNNPCYVCGLAQPEQEPVACVQDLDEVKRKHLVYEKGMDWKDPLYTTPPQRKPLTDWQPIETAPKDGSSYLIADCVRGFVAPDIRGVIHNNPGTSWDWEYGEQATHWMPLPDAPAAHGIKEKA